MKPILISGLYDLPTATGNLDGYLDNGADNGVDGYKFFTDYAWFMVGPRPFLYEPYTEKVANILRKGTGEGPRQIEEDENGIMVFINEKNHRPYPIFRLSQPNPAYDANLKFLFDEIKKREKIAWIALLDYCTLKAANPHKFWSPWYCSVEQMGPSTPDGVWGDAMWVFMLDYMRRVIRIAAASGVDYRIDIMNEYQALQGPDAFGLRWFQRAFDALRAGHDATKTDAVPRERFWCSSHYKEIEGIPAIFSPHQVSPGRILAHEKAGARLLSTDGWTKGHGKPSQEGTAGPNAEEADSMARDAVKYGYFGLEILDHHAYFNNWVHADLSLVDYEPLYAAAKVFGYVKKIKMKVCSETKLKANDFCPEIVVAEFPLGQEPTKTCTLHKAPEMEKAMVCELSGLKDNGNCVLVEREFIKGQVPTALCSTCKAPEPEPEPEPDNRSCFEKFIKGRRLPNWNILAFLKCLFK
jgi:hypothetical protein